MEKDPNLFTQGYAGRRTMEKALAQQESDTPAEAADKRRTLQQWYEARRQAARARYLRWINRRSLERRVGSADINVMGQYAIQQAARSERSPETRRRRRLLLMRRWKEFMTRNFKRDSTLYQNRYRINRQMRS